MYVEFWSLSLPINFSMPLRQVNCGEPFLLGIFHESVRVRYAPFIGGCELWYVLCVLLHPHSWGSSIPRVSLSKDALAPILCYGPAFYNSPIQCPSSGGVVEQQQMLCAQLAAFLSFQPVSKCESGFFHYNIQILSQGFLRFKVTQILYDFAQPCNKCSLSLLVPLRSSYLYSALRFPELSASWYIVTDCRMRCCRQGQCM